MESCRALERRCAELSEERASLAAALAEVQERAGRLEAELTHLTGQQNLNQRIQYHKKVGGGGRELGGEEAQGSENAAAHPRQCYLPGRACLL